MTKCPYSNKLDELLVERFINNNSEKAALINKENTYSWKELSEKIELFIKQYKELIDINKNIPLVIYGHKELDFVVAIYACLLHKIPFIPVDNIYPDSRLTNICNLSKAKYIYNSTQNVFEMRNEEEHELEEKNLAYIMFTSGTTGSPKGVQIGRESVYNLILWMKKQLNLAAPNIFMNQAPFAFDLSMYEIFGNIAYEGTIILNDRNNIKDSSTWLSFLSKKEITTWVSTPSFAMQQLLNPNFNHQTIPSLKEFLFCGEKLTKPVVKLLFTKFPSARVINSYGPTEATVATTYIDITPDMLNTEDELPCGYPVLNSEISIINEEIIISGTHVMRGYLNNSDENKKRLIIDNSKTPTIRSYKTGDYGFIKENIVYCLGRNDEQIKLNGYRIELSEIEEKILNIKDLSLKNTAVVALKRSNGQVLRLVCFYIPTIANSIEPELLKNKLTETLPSYMIPSEFIEIEQIPVSTNHKVDKKALINIYQQNN